MYTYIYLHKYVYYFYLWKFLWNCTQYYDRILQTVMFVKLQWTPLLQKWRGTNAQSRLWLFKIDTTFFVYYNFRQLYISHRYKSSGCQEQQDWNPYSNSWRFETSERNFSLRKGCCNEVFPWSCKCDFSNIFKKISFLLLRFYVLTCIQLIQYLKFWIKRGFKIIQQFFVCWKKKNSQQNIFILPCSCSVVYVCKQLINCLILFIFEWDNLI